MTTIFYTFGISLFDSLSTTLQIIVFVLLLTTDKPLRNALSFLAGLSGAYLICGLGGYLVLGQLRDFLSLFFSPQGGITNPSYYQTEFLMGTGMTAFGIWYYYRQKKYNKPIANNWILLKLRSMNSLFAFGIGLFISITSFPVSIPYLVALGRYAALNAPFPAVAGFIVLYNLGYALPMLLVLVIYLFVRRGTDDDHDNLHEKAKILNLYLTTWTMVVFGVFSMIDAGCYFVLGHSLLKDRYF